MKGNGSGFHLRIRAIDSSSVSVSSTCMLQNPITSFYQISLVASYFDPKADKMGSKLGHDKWMGFSFGPSNNRPYQWMGFSFGPVIFESQIWIKTTLGLKKEKSKKRTNFNISWFLATFFFLSGYWTKLNYYFNLKGNKLEHISIIIIVFRKSLARQRRRLHSFYTSQLRLNPPLPKSISKLSYKVPFSPATRWRNTAAK